MDKDVMIPYLRLYYDRGTKAAVVDEGPGRGVRRFRHVVAAATMVTERAPENGQDIRPAFWFAARNVVLYIVGQTAYIASIPLGTPIREVFHRKPVPAAPGGDSVAPAALPGPVAVADRGEDASTPML